jgi:carbon-monoxide dehydrogenase large subunit
VIAKSDSKAQNACECIDVMLDRDTDPGEDHSRDPSRDPLFTTTFNNFESSPTVNDSEVITVHATLNSPRVMAFALEPRTVISRYEVETESFHISLGSQTPSRAQSDFAHVLKVPLTQVRVSMRDVGGAFGSKSSLYPEELIVALCSQRLRRTIKWVATRAEECLSAMHGRGSKLQGEMKVTKRGEILSLKANVEFDLGAWLPYSAVVPMRNAARILPGPYAIPRVQIRGDAYLSHKAPVNIYRGAGRPEAALLMETLMEKSAKALNLDGVQFRLRHLIMKEDMPYRTMTGEVLDSGDYSRILLQACVLFDYESERGLQLQRRAKGECVGIGIGFYIEPCGVGWESASIEWHTDDSYTVYCGSPAQGQGHETTFAHIAAKELGCSGSRVKVKLGDTSFGPPGLGALASRSIAIGGSAIVKACQELLGRQEAGESAPLRIDAVFTSEEAWGYGCVISRLSIDPDTGKPLIEKMVYVDDAGHQVDPELVKDQLLGGCVQGIGQAMMEEVVYDHNGQLLTGSLMDYAIPRADDIPYIQIHSECTPSPYNLLGAKGVGEAGCIGVPASLLNAARDALQLLADEDIDFPLTAEKLWRCLSKMNKRESES